MTTSVQKAVQLSMFDLEPLETTVRDGVATFLKVGEALTKIRDGEGYKLRGFTTFDDYCESYFGFSVRQGQRLIAAAKTTQVVEQITGEAPASESVAREFSKVTFSPEVVEQVHQELKAEGKPLAKATATEVRKVVTKVLDKVKPKTQSSKPAPKPAAPMPEMPPAPTIVTSAVDFCPACGDIPQAYQREGDKWYCGVCGVQVVINVASA
jgi:ribosomal protein S27AE